MSYQLPTLKRLLTYYSRKLTTIVDRFKGEQLEHLRPSAPEGDERDFTRTAIQKLEEGIGAMEEATTKIRQLLQDYAGELEGMEQVPQKEQEDFQSYANGAEQALIQAFDYTILLQARLRAFKSWNVPTQVLTTQVPVAQTPLPTRLKLPALPIPVFSGNIWEWDNFWELFNENVHTQDLNELFKFNYLLSALKGEALDAVKKFQVTPDNYAKAVEFLKHKYGNTEELVFRLIGKLEDCSLRSQSLPDQRKLFEQIQVIVEQLKQKNEHVDSQWLLKRVLSKFPEHVQRKVLTKKQAASQESPFKMESLLGYLEETISNEEMMSIYMGKSQLPQKAQEHVEKRPKFSTKSFTHSCMYCHKEHKSTKCDRYKTPQERSKYLRDNGLCLICASQDHSTTQCKKQKCFKCQKPHHTSCCFLAGAPKQTSASEKKDNRKTSQPTSANKTRSANKPNIKVNVIGQDEPLNEVLELQSLRSPRNPSETFLPAGEVTVLDPNSKTLRKILVLLDTGAEISFIDSKLAEELRLQRSGPVKLRLHTFGDEQVKESVCHHVVLDIWDKDGKPFSLRLLTHDILTKPFLAPPLLEDDKEFIKALDPDIVLRNQNTELRPQVLLGSDQLWNLIRDDQPHIKLPSGLNLLPTRIGHLLTGQMERKEGSNSVKEMEKWDGYWSLDGQINTIIPSRTENSEEEKWENFWKLESSGTEEFTSSEKDIHSREDRKVWEDFNKTIERRDDSYYVRLPWKEVAVTLPDNKSIAFHRLVSVWNTLKKNESLLEQYNKVFQEQLDLNILEEVPKHGPSATRVHYIPHQGVLTPHKTTTKLRIVYDASAHFKGCPSLNDVLYRGPVILPSLFGILLRFRIGKIALISDVEKAFLQVRLHEIDRDATRCLWLHNYKLPPCGENIRILRFTRVTFGLNSSPFLLAATTHYHFDQCAEDPRMIAEMKENLYVDNLILTTDSLEESIKLYSKTKRIFEDINMNIREFVTNDTQLSACIAENDKSAEISPRVLGIVWSSSSDSLKVSCSLPQMNHVTKRTVTSAIATVYDPMGWLAPLLHRAKLFLRFLWQERYDWDVPLPEELTRKWLQIAEGMNGFERMLPRFMAKKYSEAVLVTFADASNEAIASCVYLRSPQHCDLLMAKSKLPSLRSKNTIPKMELEALTLAMRLSNAVITQVQSSLDIRQLVVLSDSEIAFSWIQNRPLKDVGVMIFNRLVEIERIADHVKSIGIKLFFGHISSHNNSADCATRGLTQAELQHHFWWKGPPILRLPIEEWNTAFRLMTPEDTTAEENLSLPPNVEEVLYTSSHKKRDEEKGSNIPFPTLAGKPFVVMKRIMARILRFLSNVISTINVRRSSPIRVSFPCQINGSTHITGKETALARKVLVRVHQRAAITPSLLKRILRLLRTAEQTAEKIAKLVTRYTLLDRLFEEQVVIGRLNSIHRHAWLNRKHRFEVDSRKVLDWAQLRSALLRRLIEELEKELRKTENRYDNVTTIENQHTFQRHQLPQVLRKGMAAEKKTSAKEITELQEKMKKQEEEMELLKQTLLSIKAQTEAASSTQLTVTVDPAEKTRRTVRSEEVPVNDQEYFEKMVREVQGEEEQQGSKRVHEEVEQQENEQKARETKPVEELHGRGQQLQRTRRRQASSGDRRLGHYPGSTKHQRRVRSPEKFDNLRRVRRSVSFEDRIKALRKQADKFEQVLRNFPFRNIGGSSKPQGNVGDCAFCDSFGTHFSDSCPDVIDGDLRYEIVSRKGLCKHCLGSCLPLQCKFNPRSCWYCEKIRGTCVEDLIPKDEGHHRALCPVPDLRADVRDRLNRLQEELEQLTRRE